MSDVVSETQYGGYTKVAQILSDLHREWRPDGFRRQQIHVWWVRRDRNGFPEKHPVVVNGKTKNLFKLSEVTTWFAGYTPSTGARRGAKAGSQGNTASETQS